MIKDLNELTPYERELLRSVVIIREHERPEVRIDNELRIPAPPPPERPLN